MPKKSDKENNPQSNLRRKNLAVLAMLVSFCAILFVTIILRQKGL